MDAQIQSTLSALDTIQTQSELSLLKLSEPLLSTHPSNHHHHDGSRASDASNVSSNADPSGAFSSQNASNAQPTPSSLAADLSHYKSLFTKLRLSYTEQVTKEKFLRALVSDSPVNALPAPNQEEVAALKRELQERKAGISRILQELEWKARELSRRYVTVREQSEELRELPERISKLRDDMGALRRERGSLLGLGEDEHSEGQGASDSGEQLNHLGLEAAVNLVETREEQLAHLDAKSDSLAEALARREKELRRVKEELSAAERSKDAAVQNAREARERREGKARGQGKVDMVDEIEEQGRWLRGVETTMKGLLPVES
ncbi:MAG: hypothetical protein M1831_000638 [Alyxoria varia]|nr:MAG: hypothetical protein M1831_000638 [Alyxoria varia]